MAKKRIPDFKSDEEVMEFWDTHSTADYWDELEPAEDVSFAGIRLKPISLRVDAGHMGFIRALAAEKGLGYQTMLRMWINERTAEELAAWERRHPRPATAAAPPRKKPARKPAPKPARKTAAKVAAKAG